MFVDWKTIKRQCSKIVILPEVIYRFSAIPIKIPAGHFREIGKLILNFIWKCKVPTIVKKLANLF